MSSTPVRGAEGTRPDVQAARYSHPPPGIASATFSPVPRRHPRPRRTLTGATLTGADSAQRRDLSRRGTSSGADLTGARTSPARTSPARTSPARTSAPRGAASQRRTSDSAKLSGANRIAQSRGLRWRRDRARRSLLANDHRASRITPRVRKHSTVAAGRRSANGTAPAGGTLARTHGRRSRPAPSRPRHPEAAAVPCVRHGVKCTFGAPGPRSVPTDSGGPDSVASGP